MRNDSSANIENLSVFLIFFAFLLTQPCQSRPFSIPAPSTGFTGASVILSDEMIGQGCEYIIRDMKTVSLAGEAPGETVEALVYATWGHGLGLLRPSAATGEVKGRPNLQIFTTGNGIPENRTNEISTSEGEIWVALFRGIGKFQPDGSPAFSKEAAGTCAPSAPVHGVLLCGETLLVGTTGSGLYARIDGFWRKIGPGEGFHPDWVNVLAPIPEGARGGGGKSIIPDEAVALAGTTRGAYWILRGPDGLITASFLKGDSLTYDMINTALVFSHPVNGGEEVWIGTVKSGIARCSGGKWVSHDAVGGDLMSDEVTDLAFDDAGMVLAGTKEGVTAFDLNRARVIGDPVTGEGVLYGMADGLEDSWIKSVTFWRSRPLAGTFSGFIYEFDGMKWTPLVMGGVKLTGE